MDPDDRHLSGNNSFMYRQVFFTCAFHGPPSGIQVSLTHSLTPSWGLRRTLTGHLNGMRFCTLGTSVQHILLASQGYRVGPEFAVVRIGNWVLTESFALATCGA